MKAKVIEDMDLEKLVEEMKLNWEEIGKLENGNRILCNKETGRILIESTEDIREPHHPEEWKKILEIINKNIKRWRMILQEMENNFTRDGE